MNEITIVKLGGKLIEDESMLDEFLVNFSKIKSRKLLIHGGGNLVTEMCQKLNLDIQIKDGRRITSDKDLDVATMILAGSINKKLVSKLHFFKLNSIGLSGADANLIKAVKRPVGDIDYGKVGDVKEINSVFLKNLIENKYVPVICSITHDGNGQLLNTNADTIASEIAISLTNTYKVNLIYSYERNGVLENIDDDKSTIIKLYKNNFTNYINLKVISNGMIPKLKNSFYALEKGVQSVKVTGKSITSSDEKYTIITNDEY